MQNSTLKLLVVFFFMKISKYHKVLILVAFLAVKLSVLFSNLLALGYLKYLLSSNDIPSGVRRPGNWAGWTAWKRTIKEFRQGILVGVGKLSKVSS